MVPPALYHLLQRALLAPDAAVGAHMAALSIRRFDLLDTFSYPRILTLETQALAAGFPHLA